MPPTRVLAAGLLASACALAYLGAAAGFSMPPPPLAGAGRGCRFKPAARRGGHQPLLAMRVGRPDRGEGEQETEGPWGGGALASLRAAREGIRGLAGTHMRTLAIRLAVLASLLLALAGGGERVRAAQRALESGAAINTAHVSSSAAAQPPAAARAAGEVWSRGRVSMMRPRVATVLPGVMRKASEIDEKGLVGVALDSVKTKLYEHQAGIAYRASKILAAPTLVKLTAMAACSAVLVALGGSALVATGKWTWRDGMFKAYSLLNNVPGTSGVDQEDAFSAFLVNLIFVTGMMTFAVALGVVTSSISVGLEGILEGNHKVLEKGHVVVLNWNDKTLPMLRQMNEASKDAKSRREAVVILASRDRAEMQEAIEDKLEGAGIQIFARHGDPTSLHDLQRVSAGDAKHVLVLTPDELLEDPKQLKEVLTTQTSCVRSLQKQKQPGKVIGGQEKDLKVLVAAPMDMDLKTMMGAQVCKNNAFVERVLAMSSVQTGLSRVHDEILDQGKGCEIYVHQASEWPWLVGRRFGELGGHFRNAVVMGWIDGDEVKLNPPADARLPEDSRLVLLTKQESTQCSRNTIKGFDQQDADARTHTPLKAEFSRKPVSVLVLNDGEGQDMLGYLDVVAPRGSKVTVLSSDPETVVAPSGGNCKFRVVPGSSLDYEALKRLGVEGFDTIIVRGSHKGDSGEKHASDSRVLTSINMLLDIRSRVAETRQVRPLHLVVSVKDKESLPTLKSSVKLSDQADLSTDWVLSTDLESGAVVQVLWMPQLKDIYEEMLDSEGGEICLLDSNVFVPYGPTTFRDISNAAMQRGAVALGILTKNNVLKLSPDKLQTMHLDEGDRVVLFADVF